MVRPVDTATPVETATVHPTVTSQANRLTPSIEAVVTTSAGKPARPAAPSRRETTPRHRAPAHAAPAVHRAKRAAVSFWFPFAALPKELLGLPRLAFHAGAESHGSGILLLLSSVAMAGLAAASLALLRSLRRLEGSAS